MMEIMCDYSSVGGSCSGIHFDVVHMKDRDMYG
jgi:hypothetical protein